MGILQDSSLQEGKEGIKIRAGVRGQDTGGISSEFSADLLGVNQSFDLGGTIAAVARLIAELEGQECVAIGSKFFSSRNLTGRSPSAPVEGAFFPSSDMAQFREKIYLSQKST